jgi:hypothetical protein
VWLTRDELRTIVYLLARKPEYVPMAEAFPGSGLLAELDRPPVSSEPHTDLRESRFREASDAARRVDGGDEVLADRSLQSAGIGAVLPQDRRLGNKSACMSLREALGFES